MRGGAGGATGVAAATYGGFPFYVERGIEFLGSIGWLLTMVGSPAVTEKITELEYDSGIAGHASGRQGS